MLAAKAVQESPLYSGQETSSRYLDMGSRRVVDPFQTAESQEIISGWTDFYREATPRVAREVERRRPVQDGEDLVAYKKTVQARTFDVMRGFLPAGVTTQLSWSTNLRQARDAM